MIDIDITVVIQLVIFLFTIVVLNLLLVKPIREIIKKREAHLSGMLAEAEKFTDQADGKLQNYEAELAKARAAGAEERNVFKGQAAEQEKAILEQAAGETQAEMQNVKAQVARDVETAMSTLRGQVGALARKAAEKVLG